MQSTGAFFEEEKYFSLSFRCILHIQHTAVILLPLGYPYRHHPVRDMCGGLAPSPPTPCFEQTEETFSNPPTSNSIVIRHAFPSFLPSTCNTAPAWLSLKWIQGQPEKVPKSRIYLDFHVTMPNGLPIYNPYTI